MRTAVSLFAGIGGFDLALQRCGVRVTAAVEVDKKCQAVLAHHFPDTVLFGDVREVTGNDLRATGFVSDGGILTGGFPCQDLSIAGRRAGLAGARSGLFWEIVRLLDETASEWFILENVPGLLNSQRGRDMAVVIGALGDLGYGVAWRVLDAQWFGVPQRRRRVFIVGCLGNPAGPAEILFEPEGSNRDFAAGKPPRQTVAGTLGGGASLGGWASDTDRMTFLPTDGGGQVFGNSGYGGYSSGVTTLTATSHKQAEENVVVETRCHGCVGETEKGAQR